jgi:TetR/AcrR family transcriptional regulator
VTSDPATDDATSDSAGPRQQRRDHRRTLGRDQILDAAEVIFARSGFHDASLREIAERAEYSVGGVYSFFDNKDELYRACFRRRGAEFMIGMRDALTSDASPRQQLHDLADWQVGFFGTYPHFARLVIRGGAIAPALSEPEQDDEILTNFHTSLAQQVDLMERGQEAGEIRPGSPVVLARMFSGLISAYQTAELEREASVDATTLLHDLLDAAFGARD